MAFAAACRSVLIPRLIPAANFISDDRKAMAQARPSPCMWVVNSPADEQPTSVSGVHVSMALAAITLASYPGDTKSITALGFSQRNALLICSPSERPAS